MTPSRIELAVLLLPGTGLRVLIVVLAVLTLTCLPAWLLCLALWLAVLRTAPLVRTLAETLEGQRQAYRTAEARLYEQEARITRLEADLMRARDEARAHASSSEAGLYRQVGLIAEAPDFLVEAARRAYRVRLHPDRHLQHREQAHARFLRAEASFERIYERRGIRT